VNGHVSCRVVSCRVVSCHGSCVVCRVSCVVCRVSCVVCRVAYLCDLCGRALLLFDDAHQPVGQHTEPALLGLLLPLGGALLLERRGFRFFGGSLLSEGGVVDLERGAEPLHQLTQPLLQVGLVAHVGVQNPQI